MTTVVKALFALLLGTSLIVIGTGLLGTALALQADRLGFSGTLTGIVMSAYFAGYVLGTYVCPKIVRSAGHVRAFSAFAATAASAVLLHPLLVNAAVWTALRFVTGACVVGLYMVIESWLNERATNESRGTIFGLYMMVTNASLMLGQMGVAFGDVSTPVLFMVTGILFCLSLLPTAVSKAQSPAPLASVSLDLKSLYINSPISVVACMLIGVANGAWGTLGAVYGAQIGIPTFYIALMMSAVMLAGAVGQFPIGKISDYTDRRYVLVAASVTTALIGCIIFVTSPRTPEVILVMVSLYGLLAYTLYSVAVAHANDHAPAGSFVQVSSGLLMLYGIGTMIGPVVAGYFMQIMRPESLFLATAAAHLGVAGYAVLRITRRPPVPTEEKESFTTQPVDRVATPQAILLNPKTDAPE